MIKYMLAAMLAFSLTFSLCAHGAIHPIEFQELKLNVKQILPNGHDPLMTNGSLQNKEFNVVFKTDVLKYGYWNNRIWSLADQHQFRWIGLDFQTGVRLLPFMDLEYGHFSKHIMDAQYPYRETGARYPI